MKISVIVCTYNRASFLEKCIESIENNDYLSDNYEIVIVNNNSTDKTEEIIFKLKSKYKNIMYAVEMQKGLSYARNRGVEVSKGETLVFFDDDTMIDRKYLSSLDTYLSEYEFHLAAGRIKPIWDIERPKWFSNAFASIIGETLYGEKERKLEKNEYAVGANMIIKKSVFDKIGYFDVGLGIKGNILYLGEEVDFFNRARKQNFKIYYLPKCTVDHHVHLNKVSMEYITTRMILEGDSNAKMIRKSNNKLLLIKEVVKRAVVLLIRDIPLNLFSKITGKNKYRNKVKYMRNKTYILGLLKN